MIQLQRRLNLAAFVMIAAIVLSTIPLSGCEQSRFVPDMATRPYPRELHTTDVVDIQVFRDGSDIELINATAHGYRDFDLWVNQRYVHHIDELPAGGRMTLSLWDFFDERGERLNAGGFFRTRQPTPVRLVEMQTAADEPMVGLIAIPEVEIVRGE